MWLLTFKESRFDSRSFVSTACSAFSFDLLNLHARNLSKNFISSWIQQIKLVKLCSRRLITEQKSTQAGKLKPKECSRKPPRSAKQFFMFSRWKDCWARTAYFHILEHVSAVRSPIFRAPHMLGLASVQKASEHCSWETLLLQRFIKHTRTAWRFNACAIVRCRLKLWTLINGDDWISCCLCVPIRFHVSIPHFNWRS